MRNEQILSGEQPQVEQQQNLQPVGDNNQNQVQSKRKKKQKVLKAENFEADTGLRRLYELTNNINWSDTMTTESGMNLVTMALKTWQYQMMPKYSCEYFLQRCQALGSDKVLTSFMHKVRRIHKGADSWDQKKVSQKTEKNKKANVKQGGVELNNPFEQLNEDYDNEPENFETFKERAEIAKKLTNQPLKTNQRTNQEQIDDLMDEDLRMFEQMNRKKNLNTKVNLNIPNSQDDGFDLGGQSAAFEDYDD